MVLASTSWLTSEEREALLADAPESADAAVRALGRDASFTEAAEAAGRSAVAHLSQARPTQCLAYLRNVSAFRRLAAEAAGAAPLDDFADTPGRRAALAILMEAHGLSRAGEEDGDDLSGPTRAPVGAHPPLTGEGE